MKAKTNQSMAMLRRNRAAVISALAAVIFPAASTLADTATGTLFYTTYGNYAPSTVGDITYNFNGTSFNVSPGTQIGPTLSGADGIAFTQDGSLAVGSQGNDLFKISPGPSILDPALPPAGTLQATGVMPAGSDSYHVMVAPDGTIYTSGSPDVGFGGEPGLLTKFSPTIASSGTVTGTSVVLHGVDTTVSTIAWVGNQAYYTTANSLGTAGNFGKVDLTTGNTTQLQVNIAGAHGMVYDPFLNSLILVGGNTIQQINPTTGAIKATYTAGFTPIANVTFDNVTVDAAGHIFVSNNNGYITFLDVASAGGLITDGSTIISTATQQIQYLDDVAPLSGPGSTNPPPATPENVGFITTALALGGICLLARNRKNSLAV
jgi:hypothetical protein